MTRACEWCGTPLPDGLPDWKSMHSSCYGAWRRREDALTSEAMAAELQKAYEAGRQMPLTGEALNEALDAGFKAGYARGVEDGKRSAPAVALDREMLRLLLQLAHPDKHAGSAASVRAAAFLNGLRERLG